jgi:hypothetical protein
MKTVLTTLLLAFAAVNPLPAKDEKLAKIPEDKQELPGGGKRWSVFSIEDAKKEAAKKKQPMAFVTTDERAEEKAIKEAALVVFWGLEKDCTMVLLPSTTTGQWKDRLPPAAYAGITDKALGKELPRAIVTDQTAATVIGSLTANQIIDGGEKAVKEFTKLMKETNKDPEKIAAAAAAAATAAAAAPAKPAAAPATAAAPAPAAGAPPTAAPAPTAGAPAPAAGPVAIKDAKPENWTSAQGSTVQATLIEVNGDTVTLLIADGRKMSLPVSSLNADSQKRVEELKGASAK